MAIIDFNPCQDCNYILGIIIYLSYSYHYLLLFGCLSKRNYMKAVIFDMDGVLIDSEPLHVLSDKTLLERIGVVIPENHLAKYVGVTNPVMWKELISEFNIQKDLEEILNLHLSLKLKLLKKSDFHAIDGIPELLQLLYSHEIPVGVASSSPNMFMKEVIKLLRLEKYIKAWVSAENVKDSKPKPDVFLKVAELLHVNPEKCVAIEDSTNGVASAKNAGMKCIGFRNINSGNQDLSKADLILDSIRDIHLQTMKNLFTL